VIYPNSTPEFRIFIKQNSIKEFQVRYINIANGYKSKWQAIKIEYETDTSNS
jgi:hypothetical protein